MKILAEKAISFDRAITLDAGDPVQIEPHENPLLVKVWFNEWLLKKPEGKTWYLLKGRPFKKVWKAFLKEDIVVEETTIKRSMDRYPRTHRI